MRLAREKTALESAVTPAAFRCYTNKKPLKRPAIRPDLEDLLSRCIDLAEGEGDAAVDALLAQHVEVAPEIRELMQSLRDLGVMRESAPDRIERLGEYAVIRRLGQGGAGVVYLACQESVQRLVALKVLHPQLTDDPRLRERLRREARALAKLRHPNIVSVLDCAEDGDRLYIAMEYVAGVGLDTAIATTGHDRRQCVLWIRDIARALQCAHDASVVHRDVKPSNIRIGPDGGATLLDFGLAKDHELTAITFTAGFQGSPHYASPEQVSPGSAIGPATDVYSLGVTLCEAITGDLPFAGDTTEQIFYRILHESPAAPVSGLPRDLRTIIEKATEREPSRRYESAGALADDLDAFLELRPIAARPPRPARRALMWARRHRASAAAAVVGVLAVIALVVALILQQERASRARRDGASRLLADARGELARLADMRGELAESVRRVRELERTTERGFHEPEVWHELSVKERALRRRRVAHEQAAARVRALLARAAQLDPDRRDVVDALAAETHLEQWRLATARNDADAKRLHGLMVASLDPSGQHADELAERQPVSIATVPPGADVWLFRYESLAELGKPGEPRLVPVAIHGHGETVPRPGTWCLEVERASGEIERGDLIFELAGWPVEDAVFVTRGSGSIPLGARVWSIDDRRVRACIDAIPMVDPATRLATVSGRRFVFREAGGREQTLESDNVFEQLRIGSPLELAAGGAVAAKVFRNGGVRDVTLPAGLALRPTAAPLLRTERARVGASPVRLDALAAGSYVALLTKEGYEPQRVAFDIPARDAVAAEVALVAEGQCPPGFVRVHDPGHGAPFWIGTHETTCAEYARFLNQPETLRAMRASEAPILFPRDGNAGDRPLWRRRRGRFDYRPANPTSPVMGISLEDARRYALWRSEQARAAGEPWRFRVPTLAEVQAAAQCGRAGMRRRFVHGAVFRPGWVKSMRARNRYCVESCMSYPIDESAFGVMDLMGSMVERTDTPVPLAGETFYGFGGSWIADGAIRFSEPTQLGIANCGIATGFRLVAVRRE